MPGKDFPQAEQRKYLRLDSVFPVQFRLVSLDKKENLSSTLQGFTSNISRGGICLEVNNLAPEYAQLIKERKAKISLELELPLHRPIKALAQIAWEKELIVNPPNKFLIGLSYEEISAQENSRIIRIARTKKLLFPGALFLIILLGVGVGLNAYLNIKLIRGNKALVAQLVRILQESSIAKQKIKKISKDKEDLQIKIGALELRIKSVEEEKSRLGERIQSQQIDAARKAQELGSLIEDLKRDKNTLQEELISLQQNENIVTEELLRLDKSKANLEKANIDKMYQWLKMHQNLRMGLIASFEGDATVADSAFTYDQALVVLAYTYFGDFERAKKILDFYLRKARRQDGFFLNAYYVKDGSPGEYIVHSGPNIWLGMASLHYARKTRDQAYLNLAEEIARKIISLQDKEGGISGGPTVSWYSTEHNLDAYAFFNMLYAATGRQEYLRVSDKILNWLTQHVYDRPEIPVKRGKGDSTIATDTYAWSIAAIGPAKLEEIGMQPDRIMEFAQQNCSIEVSYARPDGQIVKVKGFDFAPQRNLARGGVVSSEWTAQMAIAYKIMADFYYQKEMIAKARTYALKADEYLAELGNMIISSPSPSGQGESCLPYATQENSDTGHGWMTPKGNSTGSVAATAYTIFAYYNYNPLELED